MVGSSQTRDWWYAATCPVERPEAKPCSAAFIVRATLSVIE
jgi:hypothetical protein